MLIVGLRLPLIQRLQAVDGTARRPILLQLRIASALLLTEHGQQLGICRCHQGGEADHDARCEASSHIAQQGECDATFIFATLARAVLRVAYSAPTSVSRAEAIIRNHLESSCVVARVCEWCWHCMLRKSCKDS